MARRNAYLQEKLNTEVSSMLEDTERRFSNVVQELLREEVERWRRTKQQLEPKESKPGSVGRPRASAEEKLFKDRVERVDGYYLRLREHYKESFDEFFADQMEIYRKAVEEHDYPTIAWWVEKQPWQSPRNFKTLWSASKFAAAESKE